MQTILRSTIAALALATFAGAQTPTPDKASPQTSQSVSLPSDADIHALLVDRVDVQHKSVGMVVGIISPQGRRIISYGKLDQSDPRALTGDTVFEIGSVTKIFTALLLADAVHRGEVALDDPLAEYLPKAAKVPERNGKKITLVDLATQTSGLPFLPSNMGVDLADIARYKPEQLRQIFSSYTGDQLYQFLSSYRLTENIGTKWGYSNLGFGLLGNALSRGAGMDYAALVHGRIAGPLGMKSTAINVSPDMKTRLVATHDGQLKPAPDWSMPVFPGAGSLHSTANDLLTFLGAFMGYSKSSLTPSLAAMLETRRPGPNLQQALGWWVIPMSPGDEGIVTHGGETFGNTCTVAFDPKTRIGVVVLSNSANNDGGLAWHLLRPTWPVETSAAAKAIKERKEIALDPKVFDQYAGKYQPPPPGEPITIAREGDMLVVTFGSEPQGHRLYAESVTKFFLKEADLVITFQTDARGRSTGMTINFGGTDSLVPRIDSAPVKK